MAACGATETIACSKSKSGIPSKAEDRKAQYNTVQHTPCNFNGKCKFPVGGKINIHK
jgi:hypothetical protein